MRFYAETSSQRQRQLDAEAEQSAALRAEQRKAQRARFLAAYEKRKAASDRRAALESDCGFAAVRTGADYERFVARCLASSGYAREWVGGSGDYGADLLVSLPDGNKAVLQCKFYTHPVGYDAVKEAFTAKAIYGATAALVVTNATFTPQARETARRLGVILTTHADLAAALNQTIEQFSNLSPLKPET